jgi:ribosomal protein L11 methyltransferase
MPWLQLTLDLPATHAEAASTVLEDLGAISVTLTDAAGEIVIETHWQQAPLWSKVRLAALLPEDTDVAGVDEQLRQHLALEQPPGLTIERVDDRDWANAWKAQYQPLHLGGRLWVCPSWCEPPDPTAVNVILDPGMAFGTGSHPTTALCLEWLAGQNLHGTDVLDYGCGSGILAVAALKLGARHAIATDLDEQALAVTRENAARNGVADRLAVLLPADVPTHVRADVVVANILVAALIELAPTLTAHVAPRGALALSGILTAQADEVSVPYAAAFALEARERDGWTRLAGRKRT